MKVIFNNKYGWLEHLSLFKKVIKEWNESEDFSLSNLFYLAVIYSRLYIERFLKLDDLIWFILFNATFSNISAIPVLVVEEAWVPGENHRPWTSNW